MADRKPWETNGPGQHALEVAVVAPVLAAQTAAETVPAVCDAVWGAVGLRLILRGRRG